MPTATIKNNTVYNTDTLQELVDLVTFRRNCTIRVEYGKTDEFELGYCLVSTGDRRGTNNRRQRWQAHPTMVVNVPRQSFWKQAHSGMELLSTTMHITVGKAKAFASMDFSAAFVKALQDINNLFANWGDIGQKSEDLSAEAKRHIVRLDNMLPTKKKLTPEESLRHMRDQYGWGGSMGGSSRTSMYHWDVGKLEMYYRREWERRDKWRLAMAKKGIVLQPHELNETFPQYLVRVAKAMETEGKYAVFKWCDAPKYDLSKDGSHPMQEGE
jgi:hypothetical protein